MCPTLLVGAVHNALPATGQGLQWQEAGTCGKEGLTCAGSVSTKPEDLPSMVFNCPCTPRSASSAACFEDTTMQWAICRKVAGGCPCSLPLPWQTVYLCQILVILLLPVIQLKNAFGIATRGKLGKHLNELHDGSIALDAHWAACAEAKERSYPQHSPSQYQVGRYGKV